MRAQTNEQQTHETPAVRLQRQVCPTVRRRRTKRHEVVGVRTFHKFWRGRLHITGRKDLLPLIEDSRDSIANRVIGFCMLTFEVQNNASMTPQYCFDSAQCCPWRKWYYDTITPDISASDIPMCKKYSDAVLKGLLSRQQSQ